MDLTLVAVLFFRIKHEPYVEKQLSNLGARIKALRKTWGYRNYEQFAYEHEINRSQYGRYENSILLIFQQA